MARLAALLLLAAAGGAAATPAPAYPDCRRYSVSSPDDYTLCWDRKAVAATGATELRLQLQVKTLGWIGFGIPEQTVGGMGGADIMGLEYLNGRAVVRDYHATGEATPVLDTCSQDWRLLSTSQSNGVTTAVVSRRLAAHAAQEDRSITAGLMKVILAYGSSPMMAYHGKARKPAGLALTGVEEVPLPADAYGVKLLMKNYKVQRQRTTYACQAFDMTEYTNIDEAKWAVRFEMLDTAKPRGAKHIVHHAGLYSCRYRSAQWQRYTTPGQCGTDSGVECGEVVFAWALGMGPLSMPLEAGFKVDHWVNRFLILEIHYDNPEGVEEVDDSGVLMTLSRTARQHEAGVMHIGDPFVGLDGRVIPAGAPYTIQGECRTECTSTMPTPVTIFASHLHMHNIGKRIRVTQVRNGKVVAMIDRIDFWDFDFQGTNTVDSLVMLPGDALHTTCEWENKGAKPVRFGLATDEEMCMAYLYTYPAHISYCGWYNVSTHATACGRNSTPVAWVQTNNPVRDPTVLTDPAVPVVFGQPATCPPVTPAPSRPVTRVPVLSTATPAPSKATPSPFSKEEGRDLTWVWIVLGCLGGVVFIAVAIPAAYHLRSSKAPSFNDPQAESGQAMEVRV